MRSPYAYERPVANEKLVRDRDRRRARELLWLFAAVLPVASALLVYIAIHRAVLDEAFRIGEMETRLKSLERQERELALDLSYLQSPPRVETLATERLGMAPPEPSQVVYWADLAAAPVAGSMPESAPPRETPR